MNIEVLLYKKKVIKDNINDFLFKNGLLFAKTRNNVLKGKIEDTFVFFIYDIIDSNISKLLNDSITDESFNYYLNNEGYDIFVNRDDDTLLLVYNEIKNILEIYTSYSEKSLVFYYLNKHYVRISNSYNQIVNDEKFNAKINENKIVEQLVFFYNSNETFFENLFMANNGDKIIFRNNKVSHINNPIKSSKLIKYNKISDYKEHFYSIFNKSLMNEVQKYNDVNIMQSSGLDSMLILSSLVEIKDLNINTITSVPYYDISHSNRNVDESYLIKKYAKLYKNIKTNFIDNKNIDIIKSLNNFIDIHNGLIHAAGNVYWLTDIYRLSKNKLLMHGSAGNFTVSWPIPFIYNINSSYGIQNIVKKKIKGVFKKNNYRKSIYNRVNENTIYTKQLKVKMNDFISDIFNNKLSVIDSDSQQQYLINKYRKSIYPLFSFSEYYNMNLFDPTNTPEIIRFMLSIPDELFYKKEQRFFIKSILKDKLPNEIVNNKLRGLQASDINLRLLKQKKEIIRTIDLLNRDNSVTKLFNLNSDFDIFSNNSRKLLFFSLFLHKNNYYGK